MGGRLRKRVWWPALFSLTASIACAHAASDAAPTLPSTPPQHIVSLNMCTDELLLRLASPSRIASVTWLSRDHDASNVAELAAHVPVNHGLAEEVIPLAPDLVLAGTFTTRTAVALLKRTHAPLVEFDIANTIEELRAQVRKMATLLQERERGEQLIHEIDRRLNAIGPVNASDRPRAIVLNPDSFTAGPGSLVDEAMTGAGLDNVAAHLQLGNYERVPLEMLINQNVDLLIVNARLDGPPALATELLHHPVLSQLGAHTRIVVLPSRFWNCPGPGFVEGVERLKAVADDIRAHKANN
jgi:iron complex transport system substrate-binding protein